MPQLNDCRYDALIAQGFTGHTNDMLLAWAQAGGATSNQLNDALLEYLLLNGATSNCLTDAWYEALGSLGLTGARNDRELSFWCDLGGAFDASLTGGWTGLENCGGPITQTPINLTGGWTGLENCGGSINVKQINLTGGWTGLEDCQ